MISDNPVAREIKGRQVKRARPKRLIGGLIGTLERSAQMGTGVVEGDDVFVRSQPAPGFAA